MARPVLGGLGNFDEITNEITMERESGIIEALTLGRYNPVSRQWSHYWSSSLTGTLEIPMIGELALGIELDHGVYAAGIVWATRRVAQADGFARC